MYIKKFGVIMSVKFKLVRTYDRKNENFPRYEIVHIKSNRVVFSVLGDDRVDQAIHMADQYEADPSMADVVLRLKTNTLDFVV